MRLFFVNTDLTSNKGISRHDAWLERGVAVTSGNSDYRKALERIPKGSFILAYASKRIRESPRAQPQGLVAVGEVLDDELVEVAYPDTISPFEPIEFHRSVSWLRDLRSSPIERVELVNLLGQGPMHAVQEVHSGKLELLGRLELIALAPTIDPREYARCSAVLRGLGPMARPSGVAAPRRLESSATQFYRDPKVRAWTLQRAEGCCELCSTPAPFLDEYQQPFLESHHIQHLVADGPDTPENAAALCPNCHRELHHGVDRFVKSEKLRLAIGAKEAQYLNRHSS